MNIPDPSPKLQAPNVPSHVGFIMDGNRRWAKARGLKPMKGHEAGVDAFHRVVKACLNKGVKCVSAYTFSTENWQRTQEEVSFLMRLVPKVLQRYLDEFHRENIRIVILGTREKLSAGVIKAIEKAESVTANNTAGTVALCFNYGGLQEIADAVKSIVKSGVDVADLKPSDIQAHLYHPEVPPCDLIVRVSGEKRLSGFMLPRSEYAEFIFDDTYWPDVDEKSVDGYLAEYASRQRRYGK